VKAKENGGLCSLDPKADNDKLRNYMSEVLPEYDHDRVYPSDIRKMIVWYNLLINANITVFVEEPSEEAKEETKEENKEEATVSKKATSL
jgi:hypothetical protein